MNIELSINDFVISFGWWPKYSEESWKSWLLSAGASRSVQYASAKILGFRFIVEW